MALPRVFVQDVTRAEPAHYGILSPAVSVVEDTDGHWTGGFSYESLDCGTSSTISSVCSVTDAVTVVDGDASAPFREYLPFIIETTFSYSTLNASTSNYEDLARERLLACQQKTIETEFWRGVYARDAIADDPAYPNRFLTRNPVDLTPTAGTAVKPKWGQALLEDALGACGCGVRGTLHVTRGTASSLGLSGSDGVMMTGLDNYVVAGAGYDGAGPTGDLPDGDERWMYATGPVTVRLGEINTRVDVNHSINKVTVYADRPAAVTWDTCCHFAVLVDLAADYS